MKSILNVTFGGMFLLLFFSYYSKDIKEEEKYSLNNDDELQDLDLDMDLGSGLLLKK